MTVLRCHANSNEHDRQIEPFCSSYMIGLPSFLLGYTFVFYVPSENATLIPVIVSAMRWSWTSYVIFIYILSIYITYIYIFQYCYLVWTAVLFDWHSSWCRTVSSFLYIILRCARTILQARISERDLWKRLASSFLRGSQLSWQIRTHRSRWSTYSGSRIYSYIYWHIFLYIIRVTWNLLKFR